MDYLVSLAPSVETLLILVVILQLVDLVTTYRVLDLGGVEKNPLLTWLAERLRLDRRGMMWLILSMKIAFVAAITWLAPRLHLAAWAILLAIYLWIAWNNLRALRRQLDLNRSR